MSFIEGPHPLLEARSPAYSSVTVRRAFIVWMHCGQRNTFKDVCNYYHYLESMEDKLPAGRRASSRHHEFNMFSTPPPTSPYLDLLFPKLYALSNIHHYIQHADRHSASNDTFKLETLTDLKTQNNVTANEILKTSDMIKTFCKSRMIPLRKFLFEFKEFARRCQLNYTVQNVSFYIKRKMVEEELLMVENYTKSLKFLNLNGEHGSTSSLDLKKLPSFEDVAVETRRHQGLTKYHQMLTRSGLGLSKSDDKQITILKRQRQDLVNQYWNDLTSNYAELHTRSLTRI